jgi:amidase
MGNLVPRHLGIPTVTVPMGLMSDIGMPVGLTIAGRAYDDVELVGLAHAVESLSKKRVAPPRTPALADEAPLGQSIPLGESNLHVQIEQVRLTDSAGSTSVDISARVSASTNTPDIAVFVNGVRVKPTLGEDGVLSATAEINTADVTRTHSQWRQPYGPLVVIVARSADGSIAGALATSEGTPL